MTCKLKLATGVLSVGIALCALRVGATENFFLTKRTVEIPESGFVTNTVLGTASHNFSFLSPRDWILSVATGAVQLTWTSPDRGSFMTLTILPKAGEKLTRIQPSELRQTMRARFPDAKVSEEDPCYCQGQQGVACDAEYVVAGKFTTVTRLAVFPFSGGVVEFSLTTPASWRNQRQLDLGLLLNSFTIERRPTQ